MSLTRLGLGGLLAALEELPCARAAPEPPAGIEPATPSVPFVLPDSSSKAAAGQGTVSVRG